jgi:hypothetical protein
MSPRNFDKLSKLPTVKYDQKVLEAPNLWYAFTTVTGISNISKLFTYTPKEISINPVKDSFNGR